jgi:hypothetical protein
MKISKLQLVFLLLMAAGFVISVISGVVLEWGLFGIKKC